METRRLQLALPQMAVGGLSENWLFKELGDLHWSLLAEHFGVPVTELRDAQGDRVLPVFIRIRLDGPHPLSAFREGDECELSGRLSGLDEQTFVSDVELRSGQRVIGARLMTGFAKRVAGNNLVLGAPEVAAAAAPLPATDDQREFHREFMGSRNATAAATGLVFTGSYGLNPYYDLNGAGLLYFASYPHINDHCEREYAGTAFPELGADWSVAMSTVSRDVVYLGNCGPDDTVGYRLESCRAEADGRVRLVSSLVRESDGGLLAKVTTVKEPVADLPRPAQVAAAPRPDLDVVDLTAQLLPVMAQALPADAGPIDADTDLRDQGLDSFALVTFATDATERLGFDVDASRLFQRFTVADIARTIAGAELPAPAPRVVAEPAVGDVAVIGMAGRFPGADSVDELWQLLVSGGQAISEAPARANWSSGEAPRRGGFLRDVARFDQGFFRISPREAELMDPQQRLFLEVAWAAFEDAGYDVTRLRGSSTGVFAGVCHRDYAALLRAHQPSVAAQQAVATSFSAIPNRVSFAFGFHGSSVAVDTMCSSSLVAVAQAVRELQAGECEQALVGGVNVICDRDQHLAYSAAGALSPDGLCRTFDEQANGYVRGEGVCALVLKPLRRALADGDQVHGVIKGAAVNHGGQAQSLTAPNVDAQAALVVEAHRKAGVDPATVGYLEAHGTGTPLGDPIEVAGLVQAFDRLYRAWGHPPAPDPHCGIGSLKTNIGHLESAAGIAGMIKVLLAMRHRMLPANQGFQRLNPRIELAGSPFHVQAERAPWTPRGGVPRRAGVSSFGMGGTNAHVVLEEAPPAPQPTGTGPQTVVLSAATREALAALADELAEHLAEQAPPLPSIAFTTQVGRAALAHRCAIVTGSPESLREHLGRVTAGSVLSDVDDPGAVAVARQWVSGDEVDWAARWPSGDRPQRVSLPTYPFGGDRHWIVPDTTGEFLTKTWQPSTSGPPGPPVGGTFLVLATSAAERAAAALFAGSAARTSVVRADRLTSGPDALETALLATGGLAEGEAIAGVVDLTDWCAGDVPINVEGRVAFLQQVLARYRLPSLRCLHVTRGLQRFGDVEPELAGAELAGLYRVLSSEFGSVESRTVDVDFDSADELDRVLTFEVAAGDRQTEVCYRDGQRYQPRLEFAATGTGPDLLGDLSDGAVLITGGTGEIGLRAARELHELGAQHLVLIGRRRLPARAKWPELARDEATDPALRRKLTALLELESRVGTLQVRTNPLTDVASLRKIVSAAHRRSGGISAVLHCAGTIAESRSLLTKSTEEFWRTAQPKVQAVRTLWAALEGYRPRALVLFSSVSAALPVLGASYSDYATSNGFLDFFAVHTDGAGCAVRSVQWPLWRGVGMGRDRTSSSGELGIPDLTEREGLDLLRAVLRGSEHPTLLPCRADRAQVDLPELLLAPEPRAATTAGAGTTTAPVPGGSQLEWLTGVFARTLRTTVDALPADADFADLGIDSLLLAELVRELEAELARPVDPSLLQENPTLAGLAAVLAPQQSAAAAAAPVGAQERGAGPVPIAVIGLACRFPGAPDPAAYWRNLVEGRDSVREVPSSRWDVDALYSPERQPGRSTSKWGGFIDDAAEFDPDYFGFDDSTAQYLDPLVRKALEVGAECFRDAGYREEELKGRAVGVYVGSRSANYREYVRPLPPAAIIGLNQNFIAAHLSQAFDLTGPNMVVDTACSSSLVTVHLACQALAAGEAELALAGGVDLLLDEEQYLLLSEAGALSPTGRCRTFDRDADGFVPGEGGGMVLLKRLDQAERDGDRVLAVIESGSVNNDGRTMGHTTPSGAAQRELIERTLARAGIDARSIGYVEAHGTGTMIGDPIELQALTANFRRHTDDRAFCGVGSVKSNIGHLLSAAGVAGLMKVVLALHHQQVPPTLHCSVPNPRFAFPDSPFYPVTELRDFSGGAGLQRAAVSAFGFGGTNAHLVLRRAEPGAVRRGPLPPPEYRRRHIWFDRDRQAAPAVTGERKRPAPSRRSARLDLTFLTTG
ncbi:beta-ketoacyl synthase N-terminal-like domain-containing protein [Saccharopolyspora sp. NPDC000359]|uniref:beta-ketoacyl synthase N-terminal-like domain-containing protein n=1 Tax=Saccharopolyspora sp. NPDC000359 TaxID=3154251 RepID=UPI00331F7CE7